MSRVTDGILSRVSSDLPASLPQSFETILRLDYPILWLRLSFLFFFFNNIPFQLCIEWLESSLLALSQFLPYGFSWTCPLQTSLFHTGSCGQGRRWPPTVSISPFSSDLSAFSRLWLYKGTSFSWLPGPLTLSHLSLSPAAPLRPSLLIPSHFLTLKHWPQHPDHFCFQQCSALSGLMESPGARCHLFGVLVSSGCHDKIP